MYSAILLAAISILALQGLLMLVDEFWFHRRREIPRWERIGHPLDTITVLAPHGLALLAPSSQPWTGAFFALAIVSCLFVTKDEWVHARICVPGEQWLHALLFLLHPALFVAVWFLWKQGEVGWIALQTAVTFGFLCWQLLYWNGPWAPKSPRSRSGVLP
jgi:hypothetical protein